MNPPMENFEDAAYRLWVHLSDHVRQIYECDEPEDCEHCASAEVDCDACREELLAYEQLLNRYELNPDLERCRLCGEIALGDARGWFGERLCHDDERSCYHRWTVYNERPWDLPQTPPQNLLDNGGTGWDEGS